MAELVDALDLGSSAARRESSSLSIRTIFVWPTASLLEADGFKLTSSTRTIFDLTVCGASDGAA